MYHCHIFFLSDVLVLRLRVKVGLDNYLCGYEVKFSVKFLFRAEILYVI